MIELIKQNWEIIAGGATAVFAFIGGRKMKGISEKDAEANALSSMQKSYDSFVIDFKERYVELKEMQIDLKNELKENKAEINLLQIEIKGLQIRNENLQKEVDDWVLKYTRLKKDFDILKKKQ